MICHFSSFGYPSHVDARNFWWQQFWFSISMDPWAWCCVLHITSGLLSNFFSVHRSMRQLSLPCFDIIGHMQFLGAIIFCVRSLVGSSQALVSSNVPEFAIAFHFFLSNLAVFCVQRVTSPPYGCVGGNSGGRVRITFEITNFTNNPISVISYHHLHCQFTNFTNSTKYCLWYP